MKKIIVLFLLLFAVNSNAMDVYEFTDYSDGTTTIDGTSNQMYLKSAIYIGAPVTIQITNSSTVTGTLQGLS